jgi:hypothetical protein
MHGAFADGSLSHRVLAPRERDVYMKSQEHVWSTFNGRVSRSQCAQTALCRNQLEIEWESVLDRYVLSPTNNVMHDGYEVSSMLVRSIDYKLIRYHVMQWVQARNGMLTSTHIRQSDNECHWLLWLFLPQSLMTKLMPTSMQVQEEPYMSSVLHGVTCPHCAQIGEMQITTKM